MNVSTGRLMRMIRVFPRMTRATPTDELSAINRPPGLFDLADEVHISVAFTYDMKRAEWLAKQWKHVGKVMIGGPATGMRSEEFVPGRYIKHGYVITSRGCPNKCWFCSVWKREGNIRELPIREGWNVLDNNLLACSEQHIKSVFAMLKKQKEPIEFTGGLEAKLLQPWHVDLMKTIKIKQMFFAYDTEDDYEPLVIAGRMLNEAGFTISNRKTRCYALCGYPNDTIDKAELRMKKIIQAGFIPMAMLYKNEDGYEDKTWRRWQRVWVRPSIIMSTIQAGL